MTQLNIRTRKTGFKVKSVCLYRDVKLQPDSQFSQTAFDVVSRGATCLQYCPGHNLLFLILEFCSIFLSIS